MNLYNRINRVLDTYAEDSEISIINSSELDGFFHAIGCAPEVIPPSTWMSAIWGGEDQAPEWPDMTTAQDFMNDIMLHYNRVMGSLAQETCTPLFLEEIKENCTEFIPQDWCLGFQRGLGLIGDAADILAEHLELITPVMVFSSEESNGNNSLMDRLSASVPRTRGDEPHILDMSLLLSQCYPHSPR